MIVHRAEQGSSQGGMIDSCSYIALMVRCFLRPEKSETKHEMTHTKVGHSFYIRTHRIDLRQCLTCFDQLVCTEQFVSVCGSSVTWVSMIAWLSMWISEWVTRDIELLYIYTYDVDWISNLLKIWVNVSRNTYANCCPTNRFPYSRAPRSPRNCSKFSSFSSSF